MITTRKMKRNYGALSIWESLCVTMWCCRRPNSSKGDVSGDDGTGMTEPGIKNDADATAVAAEPTENTWALDVVDPTSGNRHRQRVLVGPLLHENVVSVVHSAVWERADTMGGPVDVVLSVVNRGDTETHARAEVQMSERVRIARTLGHDHPNIVRFFGCPINPLIAEPAALFEHILGGNLASYLRHTGDLPITETFRVLSGVASALEFLSTRDTPHRAVSAAAVLLTADRTPKLTLPKPLSHPHAFFERGRPLKVVRWMAPEVLKYGEFSAAADVWSFGVLCYEAFNRAQLPFTGYSNVEAYDKINAGIPVPLDSIRRLAPTVVTRCFNFEPDRRPTAAALEGALTSSKAQGCEGSDDNTDGVVALARQHRDSVDIDDGHRPGESFISVSDGTGLNLPPAAQDSETTDMGPDDVFGEDSDYAGENEDCAFGVTRERPAVRLMRPVPIRPDQLVPFAMRVSDAIDKAGDPVPFESTSLFPLSRATTQPVRLSRGEHDSFRSRSMYWKFGTVVEPADVPAELWTLGTLTETVTLAILYQANLLLKAAQSSSREGRLTAITQWAFSILSFGLPQCVPLRTGSRFGCVAGADCNFHAFCEPVKDDSGSVAFGLTSSDISFGVSGTCSKIIQWDDGVLYVRNGLVIEVTLGESAGYNRYSVELPDAAFLGLDGGQVSRSLAGTGQVASTDSATKLEISFNADGDDQGDSMAVTGTAVFDEKNSVATIEGRTHTSATLSFHASPGQPIRLNAKEARMPLFVSVRPTTNPQEEQWNALTSKLPTNPNEFATDFVTKARALWSKASDSSRGRDEPFVFSVSRDGRVSAGLTGHQLPSALRRSSVCRNDLYPFEDSETRVRAARVQIRRDLICTRRSSSGSVRRASSRANAQCDRTSTPRVVIESV